MQPILFFVVATLVTGVIYPLAVTAVVQVAFPKQSNGSLILKDSHVIGSELIAQNFENPKYFWPRPSASNYNAVPSAASNLGPTNPSFPKNPIRTTSASGLDPHITLDMARTQITRISKARKIKPEKIEALLAQSKEPYVNVLMMNLKLDSL
jgi:K+-transporting ATPase ATPase C chain